MQYNISINQKAFTEIAPDCDIIDAAILDFINQFIASGQTDRIIKDDKDWFWVSYKKIIDENPILGIKSKKTIYRRVNKLIDAEILKRYEGNQKKARTYFGRGKYYNHIFYTSDTDVRPPRTQMSDPPRTQMSDDHSTNNDHNTNHSEGTPPEYEIPTQNQVQAYFKDSGDMLEGDPLLEAQKFINHYAENEWKASNGKRIKNWHRQAGTWMANYKQYNRKRIHRNKQESQTMSYHNRI